MPLSGLVDIIVSLLSSVIPDQFIGIGSNLYSLLPVAVFVIFVYLIYKSLKIAFHGMLVFVAGALFPLFANNFFGTAIAIGIDSMLSYGLFALILYLGYVFIGTVKKILRVVTWPARKLFSKSKDFVTKDDLDKKLRENREDD